MVDTSVRVMAHRTGRTADAPGFGTVGGDVDLTTAGPGHASIAACLQAQVQGTHRSAVGALLGVSPLSAKARPRFQEALCAQEVADVLDRLGAEWVVLHDVPIGATTLAHLAIGPGGVFAIESRRYRRANVWVDCSDLVASGTRTPDLDDVALAAALVGEHLESALGRVVEVQPVLVVLDAASLEAADGCDVRIVSPGHLLGAIIGPGSRLSVRAQDMLALAAVDPDTWASHRIRPPVESDAEAWTLLRRDVARSRARSGRWLIAALVVSALVVSAGAVVLLAHAARVVLS